MIAVNARVRLASNHLAVGTVLELVEPKPGWHRARVHWDADKCEQFVDLDKLETVAKKAGARRATYVWRVIAVDEHGQGHGNCGHDHATDAEAVLCPWSPEGWDQMPICDLLVREFRAPGIDPKRTRKARAA